MVTKLSRGDVRGKAGIGAAMARVVLAVLLGAALLSCKAAEATDAYEVLKDAAERLKKIGLAKGYQAFSTRWYKELNNPDNLQRLMIERQEALGLDEAGLERGRLERSVLRLSINSVSKKKLTIHWAAMHGPPLMIEDLLNEGVKVNTRDKDGMTPLHLAAAGGRLANVTILVRRGADPLARDGKFGMTPLELAKRGREVTEGNVQPYYETIKVLTVLEADIERALEPPGPRKKPHPRAKRKKWQRKYAY